MSLAQRYNQNGKVIILSETTDEPLTFAGQVAGVPWNSDTTDHKKNFKRGVDCYMSGHWRVLEYPQIYMILDGWSAKCIREWYTHIIDTTRLQASTRYINYDNFEYVTPRDIKANDAANNAYVGLMENINETMKYLGELGIKKEDASEVLPLSYSTKIVVRVGMRELINIMEQRLCSRAYWEIRQLCNEILDALRIYSDEWKWCIDDLEMFVPKCVRHIYCTEKNSCGRMPSYSKVRQLVENDRLKEDKVVSDTQSKRGETK